MSATPLQPGFPIILGVVGATAGVGLNGGSVYIGVAGADPEVDPLAVFWDAAESIPALQPLDTIGGYITRDGSPAVAFVAADYSMRVRDRDGNQVFYAPYAGIGGTSGGITVVESIIVACSDETTALTTGTAKVTFRMPYAFILSAVRASLTIAQASGSIFTVDINEAGGTILSTKLTIENGATTSVSATVPVVISDPNLADNAVITVDIDQIGTSGAAGLKVMLIGSQP